MLLSNLLLSASGLKASHFVLQSLLLPPLGNFNFLAVINYFYNKFTPYFSAPDYMLLRTLFKPDASS